MAFDLRWKAVLRLEVPDRPVGQVTLVEFRARVQVHGKIEEASGRFIKGLLEAGVISADEVRVVESSAIWGRGALQDNYTLIGSAVWKLLGVKARRQNRSAQEVAREIGLVLRRFSSEEVKEDPAVAEVAALLRRILVQDLAPVPDPDGPEDPGDGESPQGGAGTGSGDGDPGTSGSGPSGQRRRP